MDDGCFACGFVAGVVPSLVLWAVLYSAWVLW